MKDFNVLIVILYATEVSSMILQPSVNFLFLVLTYPKICVSLPCKVIELGEHVCSLFLSPNFVNFDDNTAQPWSSQSEYLSF